MFFPPPPIGSSQTHTTTQTTTQANTNKHNHKHKQPQGNDWQDRLAIHSQAGRTFMIRAKHAQLKEWIPAIQRRINGHTSGNDDGDTRPGRSESSGSVSDMMAKMSVEEARRLAANQRPPALYDGFLEKKGDQRCDLVVLLYKWRSKCWSPSCSASKHLRATSPFFSPLVPSTWPCWLPVHRPAL